MSRSPIPRHRALLAGFCLAGALSAQAATQEEILDAALVSGDSSQLTDSHLVALRLQQQVERIRQTRTQLLDGLYQNLSQAYDPGAASMWVLPANPDNTLPFLIGDKGRVLASLSLEAGGRGLAYGTNVLTQLSGANAAHAPLLKRAVQWLVNGDPGAATAKDFKVSVVGVDKTAALNGLKSAGLQPADAACNALTDASCASASKLLVLGNGASAASLSATVRARLQAGLPILFVHTNGWNQSSTGQQILAGLGLQEGPYGGNYWDKDRVPSSRTRTRSVELGGAYGQDPALVQQIVDGSWRTDYDWSKCTSYVGRTTCDDVPGLSDFSKRVDVLPTTRRRRTSSPCPAPPRCGSGCCGPTRCGRTSATRWTRPPTRRASRKPSSPTPSSATCARPARRRRNWAATPASANSRCRYRARRKP